MRFIVLTGPKHSGKTSAGRALAELLSCGFADLDDCIAQGSGSGKAASPRALYMEGPEIFKEAEAGALAALLKKETPPLLVIASGGGIADNPAALALLEKNAEANGTAVLVFLDVSAKTAWARIREAGELPPFLKTGSPEETHRCLHERRAAAYRQLASLSINAEGKSPAAIAQELRDALI